MEEIEPVVTNKYYCDHRVKSILKPPSNFVANWRVIQKLAQEDSNEKFFCRSTHSFQMLNKAIKSLVTDVNECEYRVISKLTELFAIFGLSAF